MESKVLKSHLSSYALPTATSSVGATEGNHDHSTAAASSSGAAGGPSSSSAAAAAAAGSAALASTANANASSGDVNQPGAAASTAPTPTPGSVSVASLGDLIKERKEWVKVLIFEHDGAVLHSNINLLAGEMDMLLKLYDKRETTIASGIILLNEQYDVHRFHPPLIYGRRGDPAVGEGEGIAVCKVDKKTTKLPVYCLITYVFPTNSARAVPQLQEFCETQLAFIP